jgi:hypothetical protein
MRISYDSAELIQGLIEDLKEFGNFRVVAVYKTVGSLKAEFTPELQAAIRDDYDDLKIYTDYFFVEDYEVNPEMTVLAADEGSEEMSGKALLQLFKEQNKKD